MKKISKGHLTNITRTYNMMLFDVTLHNKPYSIPYFYKKNFMGLILGFTFIFDMV